MKTFSYWIGLSISVYLCVLSAYAGAVELPLLDTFLDGDLRDGAPVSWTGGGRIESGKLVVSGTGIPSADLEGLGIDDMSIRAAMRLTEGPIVGVTGRYIPSTMGGASYFGYLAADDPVVLAGISTGGTLCCDNLSDPVSVDFDPRKEEVIMQLDIIGEHIELRVWPADERMPADPTLEADDSRVSHGDGMFVFSGGEDWSSANPQQVGEAIFRFVRIDASPMADVLGDFNFDGTLDEFDISQLAWEIGREGHTAIFDLTEDELVNRDDLLTWVKDLKRTWFGDANLDGKFNSGDMIQAFVLGKYEMAEAASWSEGDWNGDGLFDSSDMVTAFVDGGYEQGPRTDAVAVPEPSGWSLLVTGLPIWLVRRRSRRLVQPC